MAIKFKTLSTAAQAEQILEQAEVIGSSKAVSEHSPVILGIDKASGPDKSVIGSFLKAKLAEAAHAEPVHEQVEQAALPAHAESVTVTDAVTAQVVELVDLDAKMKEAGAYEMAKRIEEIKKALQSVAADSDPATPVTFPAPNGTVVFSECRHETKITDKPGLIKVMGTAEYIEASKITLTDAKKYLSEIELAKVTTTGFGSRTLKSITHKP